MRWIIRILGVLAVLIALAVGALFVVPTDRIAGFAAERISAATGREVSFGGDIRPTLWPHLGVRAEGLLIGNPDWVSEGPMIAAEALTVRVPWSAVFAGEVQVDEVRLVAPEIILVRDADGRASWEFDTGASEAEAPVAETDEGASDPLALGLDLAEITGGRLVYRDAVSGQEVTVEALDATIRLPQDGASNVEVAATVNGTALELALALDGLNGFLAGTPTNGAVALSWPGGESRFEGTLATTPAIDGRLTLDASDFGPLAALAGQAAPALPEGFGRDRVAFEGQVTFATEGTGHVRDGRLTLDDTALNLALDYLPGETRPRLRGTVQSDRIVLPASTSTSGGGGGASGGSGGWPTDPIDVAALFSVDADIAVAIQSLDTGSGVIGPIDLRSTLENGRMVLGIERIAAYEGVVSGEVVINGRGGLSTRSDINVSNVALGPLLSQFVGYERLSGTANASIGMLAVGDTVAALMSSLSGQADLAFGAGAIEGLDLSGMIRNLDPSFQGDGARTVYDSITANMVFDGGVLSNDDLLLDAPWGGVRGEGTVDIGGMTLDYRVIPGLIRDDDGGSDIEVPILITGPWSDPSIRPDLEFLARQELAEQVERLEAEARERLESAARERVGDLIGTELGEDATLEDAGDALEDRLRDEAAGGLRRLFGGD